MNIGHPKAISRSGITRAWKHAHHLQCVHIFWKWFYTLVKNSPKLTRVVFQIHLVQEGCEGRFVLISCSRRSKTSWNVVWASHLCCILTSWPSCSIYHLHKEKSPAKLLIPDKGWWCMFCLCFFSSRVFSHFSVSSNIFVDKMNEPTWDTGKIFIRRRGSWYLITSESQNLFLFSLQAFFLFRVKFWWVA